MECFAAFVASSVTSSVDSLNADAVSVTAFRRPCEGSPRRVTGFYVQYLHSASYVVLRKVHPRRVSQRVEIGWRGSPTLIIYTPTPYDTIGQRYTPSGYLEGTMSHTVQEKQKLLNRVRRIKGQVEAIERALEEEHGCSDVLQRITSCRGAMNGLLAVVLEDHIRNHLVDADNGEDHGGSATEQLIEVVHSYFK
jgi:DNA-binding FrmR family transcriptional regulator